MIVQDFFKDVNGQCNVLNIRQPVLQVITVFVSRVVKNDIKVLKIVASDCKKTVILSLTSSLLQCYFNILLCGRISALKTEDFAVGLKGLNV